MLKWQFKSPENEDQNIEASRRKLERRREKGLEEEKEPCETCETCGEQLSTSSISAGGLSYHEDCFVCSVCGAKMEDEFYLEAGQLLCEAHHDKVWPLTFRPRISILTLHLRRFAPSAA